MVRGGDCKDMSTVLRATASSCLMPVEDGPHKGINCESCGLNPP